MDCTHCIPRSFGQLPPLPNAGASVVGLGVRLLTRAVVSRRWSPYAYAVNNPIRFIDPDGMAAEEYNKCNCGGELLYSRSYTGKDGKKHIDNYYASENASGGGGGGGGGLSGTFGFSSQAVNGNNFVRDAIANSPSASPQQPPYKLKGASFETIMEAFEYAFDLASRRQQQFVMSQVFDFTGLTVDGSSHRTRYNVKYPGGIMLEVTMNRAEPGTANGYDGRIIDYVQPYYQFAKDWKSGKGWDKDPNTMPVSKTIPSLFSWGSSTTLTGYPYAISIYRGGVPGDNERMATVYFTNLPAFKQFMMNVAPNPR